MEKSQVLWHICIYVWFAEVSLQAIQRTYYVHLWYDNVPFYDLPDYYSGSICEIDKVGMF